MDCFYYVQNVLKKINKGKHLISKCLPRISLIFSIQGLFLYGSLRRSKTRYGHAERRTGNIVQTSLVAEFNR